MLFYFVNNTISRGFLLSLSGLYLKISKLVTLIISGRNTVSLVILDNPFLTTGCKHVLKIMKLIKFIFFDNFLCFPESLLVSFKFLLCSLQNLLILSGNRKVSCVQN